MQADLFEGLKKRFQQLNQQPEEDDEEDDDQEETDEYRENTVIPPDPSVSPSKKPSRVKKWIRGGRPGKE